jgi:hypothetical protein
LSPPWVTAEQMAAFKTLHVELADLHERLLINYEADGFDADPTAVDTGVKSEF